MPTGLDITLVVIAVLLFFIWKQLHMIAVYLRGIYNEAKARRI